MSTDHLPALAPTYIPEQRVAPSPYVAGPMPPAGFLPPPPELRGKSYAAALSFVGSARRLGAVANRAGRTHPALGVAAWVFVGLAIGTVWTFVALWYLVIFGFFGVFTFPFRLMRRSSRKQTRLAQQSLAMQQHMAQTQYALAQQAAWAQHQQQVAWAQHQPQLPAAAAPVLRQGPVSSAPEIECDPRDVRAWAAENGIVVAPRGRVARAVVQQFLAAQV